MGVVTGADGYAWALWENWGGSVESVAQVARRATWALRDAGVEVEECRIDVRAGTDVESFSSAHELATDATTYILRRFHAMTVGVKAKDDAARVEVQVVRKKEAGPEWLDAGVLLEVHTSPVHRDRAEAIRDSMRPAIARGSTLQPLLGTAGSPSPEESLREARSRRSYRFSWRRVGVSAVGILLMLSIPPGRELAESYVTTVDDEYVLQSPVDSPGAATAFTILGVLAVEFYWGTSRRLLPLGVSLSGPGLTPRWLRVSGRGLLKIGGAGITAAVSIVVAWWLRENLGIAR